MLATSSRVHRTILTSFSLLQARESGSIEERAFEESTSPMFFFANASKNVNIYWLSATGLAIWFLFVHSPPLLRSRNVFQDAPFLGHLIGAYSIYLSCIHNTLVTPSVKASSHIMVGRVGMALGVIGFMFGMYCSWWPGRDPLPPLGFSIGITIGGVAQMGLQIAGYSAIRRFQKLRDQLDESTPEQDSFLLVDREELERQKKKALIAHIDSMVSLFVIACGTPAALRLAPSLGFGGDYAILIVVGVFSVVSNFYFKAFKRRLA